jgi:hypothetical protein
MNNKLSAYFLNKARLLISGKPPSASKLPSFFEFENEYNFPSYDYKDELAGSYIKKRILDSKPFMACRFGSTELEVLLTYLTIRDQKSFLTTTWKYMTGKGGWNLPYYAQSKMHLSGIFPATEKMVEEFSKRYLDDIQIIDVLGSWMFEDAILKEKYFQKALRIPLKDLESYYHLSPWTQALEGKKVLVIHPFEKTILNQYNNRENLFRNKYILPDFELVTLKAVQSVGGNPVNFDSWLEALNHMCDEMTKKEFDVALVGAGGYGLPLAAHAKKMGKKGVHLGGALQLLFGIKGKKWDEIPFFKNLYNDYWVRPSSDETPKTFNKVENGIYW